MGLQAPVAIWRRADQRHQGIGVIEDAAGEGAHHVGHPVAGLGIVERIPAAALFCEAYVHVASAASYVARGLGMKVAR